ncbi:winged helix-turn-helix transcriptional regulator [Rhodococcus fascians]|uniref:MarR family winged helix-turn-helix transcriptional regulator n=1 Tax=Rhodococcoides fascians TaxID=1828 RepID=UPI00195ADCBD|nr:MarR family winged helix-turn-helix transcriptional regulator [Rhodococcus fascians]MBM7242534.1 winged helix-turn-helix transcriptional regulator [Rhodococcus fascians]MBY3809759.1 winged helix-turn-helix transcriptional regulator [Rhodococcus fascians]MBY3840682.1 winged helix-turn-helix transcriptional regulator [Rhodococcus fascians]MBY3847173.1 winged helix-turn-helix transcriptional regulator [Rhodococcus fascians]MBY3849690.1 winged helix-turn-helix transcriptional regulator [Rhodoco
MTRSDHEPIPDQSAANLELPDGDVVITELLSYRLSRASGSLSRSAAVRYRRRFDVSLAEWRTLALLGVQTPATLNSLARRAGLDKAQMSRVVSGLYHRGLVTKSLGAGRTTQLALTDDGAKMYRGLIAEANERDRRIRRHLGPKDLRALERALATLTGLARVIEEEEQHVQPD